MKKLRTLVSIGVSMVISLGIALGDDALKPKNAKCPISGEDIDSGQISIYTKAVGVCCKKCLAKFEKDPSAYVAKVAKIKAGKTVNTKCPISGEDVDAKQTVALAGANVGLCCKKCAAKFKADPGKFIAKVKFDAAANDKCIFSGEEVPEGKVAKYAVAVGVCCKKCKAKFDKAPDEHIAKVKFSKAE